MDKKMENLVLKWTLGREGAKGSALQRGLHLPFTVSEYPFWTRAVSAQLETHKTVSAAGGGGTKCTIRGTHLMLAWTGQCGGDDSLGEGGATSDVRLQPDDILRA